MALRQMLFNTRSMFSTPGLARFSTKSNPYLVKVGIPEFLNGIGNGVESHVTKLESEIRDFQKLLVIRTLRLKKLGVPCKHMGRNGMGRDGTERRWSKDALRWKQGGRKRKQRGYNFVFHEYGNSHSRG
ncbi:uncharacterized protein [Malus domestica]|uniref:uncharacterized protein n=1 Tax=Malus domestica TaxID=3750 RepID=UPI0010A9ED9C|nr:uncharacterized protein LOC103428425 isoform X1 [Malus domestica]XP_028961087.1 uncharacterized protein LOC103428425 isoform X1 [Malus domestica]XP_028961088.1 uncharacterized protein LOC103428425 isoform X1 [Malus domestica]XP_028961089.1 uncharacterized protein LOC103428425 isoform X1 [Malus domestica]